MEGVMSETIKTDLTNNLDSDLYMKLYSDLDKFLYNNFDRFFPREVKLQTNLQLTTLKLVFQHF